MGLKPLGRFAWRWGPALMCMVIIFAASSQPKSVIPEFGAWDWIVKKAGHLMSYALLAVAWQHGLANDRPPTGRQAVLAIALAGLYGATDEYHQSFVAGRGAGILDVGIDAAGAALGVLGAWALRHVAWRVKREG